MKSYQNYINGRWTNVLSGETVLDTNPATGETIGRVARSGAEDVQMAVGAAHAARETWRKTPAPRRGEILFRAGEIMMSRKEELARLMTQERGKVLKEARGDVQEGIDMTFYFAGEGRRLLGETTPSELPNKFAMCVRDPVGVVAAYSLHRRYPGHADRSGGDLRADHGDHRRPGFGRGHHGQ